MGDVMGHAVLPGAAIGYLLAGLSLFAMSLGGFAAGLAVALAAGLVARSTVLREDASLAGFYLVSLALGVLIVSVRGSNVDLLHVLFGTVLALDNAALLAHRIYETDLDLFDEVWWKEGGDLRKTVLRIIDVVKGADDPFAAMRAWTSSRAAG